MNIIRRLYEITISVPAVFLDGCLYMFLAIVIALQTSFGSDEAAKYIEAEPLWWTNVILAAVAAGLLAIKMFRSESFAKHKQNKENEKQSNTTQFNRTSGS